MPTFSLGIDVAKGTLACCLLTPSGRHRRAVPNTPAGFATLWIWLHGQCGPHPVTVTLEATGGYEEAVATALADRGCCVHRVNPFRVKRWAEGTLLRTKTDPIDAWVLAEFGRTACKLHPWTPVAPDFRALQQLVRLRATLLSDRQAYRNRQQAPCVTPAVAAVLATLLAAFDAQVADVDQQLQALVRATPALATPYALLCSIPGIGPTTAVLLLGECGDLSQFTSSKQLVAFAGLSVQHGESGTSVHHHPHLSKRGSPRLRAALYFPAVTAMTHNARLHAWAAQLAARGKCKSEIIGAVMRKLLTLAFAVLRDGRPFSDTYRHPRQGEVASRAEADTITPAERRSPPPLMAP